MERDSLVYKVRRSGQMLAAKILPGEWLSKLYSKAVMGKTVDLKTPKTFNEKIQWCKLYYYPKDPLVVQGADKYAVREYIKQKGLAHTLVPLLGAWADARDIDWDALPDRFVLKCNHGCAYNILCPDKAALDKEATVKQLNKWLKEDFGAFNLEWHYSEISPRMITCEEFLGGCITDYKFFCFNGQPELIYVSNDLIHDRQAQIGFFDLEGKKLPLKRDDYADVPEVTLPDFYPQMLEDAKRLCQDFPFVRVDFFLANDRYYFAELTFTPGAGMMPFNPARYDLEWGNMLEISELIKTYGKK